MQENDTVKLIREKCAEEKENLVGFLRQLIRIRSVTGSEKEAVAFLVSRMAEYGFDEAYVDAMGNAVGRIGTGKTVFLYDAHIDTVDPGVADEWGFDPLHGKYENGVIYGRGACDDKGPLAALVFAGKILKQITRQFDFTLYVVGSLCEEDCEGLALRHFVEEKNIRPDYVVIAEASGLRICLGHRGRAQFTVTVPGKPGHASKPDQAENSLYKAAKIINEIENLGNHLKAHPILGPGTIAATKVETKTNSINTIPGETVIYVDRRLTFGETKAEAQKQLADIAKPYGGKVAVMVFDDPSYTGVVQACEEYFPPWLMEEENPYVSYAREAYCQVFEHQPQVGVWGFCTNGVYTCGSAGWPTIGFGPGSEKDIHCPGEQVTAEQLEKSLMFYAYLPMYITRRR